MTCEGKGGPINRMAEDLKGSLGEELAMKVIEEYGDTTIWDFCGLHSLTIAEDLGVTLDVADMIIEAAYDIMGGSLDLG